MNKRVQLIFCVLFLTTLAQSAALVQLPHQQPYISLKRLILNDAEATGHITPPVKERLIQPNAFSTLFEQKKIGQKDTDTHKRIMSRKKALQNAYFYYKWFETNQESCTTYYQQYQQTKPEKNPVLIFYNQLKKWGHIPQDHTLDENSIRYLVPKLSLNPLFAQLPHDNAKNGARQLVFGQTIDSIIFYLSSTQFFAHYFNLTQKNSSLLLPISNFALYNNQMALLSTTDNSIFAANYLTKKIRIFNVSFTEGEKFNTENSLLHFNTENNIICITNISSPDNCECPAIGLIIDIKHNKTHSSFEDDSEIVSPLREFFSQKNYAATVKMEEKEKIMIIKKDYYIIQKKIATDCFELQEIYYNQATKEKQTKIVCSMSSQMDLITQEKDYIIGLTKEKQIIIFHSKLPEHITFQKTFDKMKDIFPPKVVQATENIAVKSIRFDPKTGTIGFLQNNHIKLFIPKCNLQDERCKNLSCIQLVLGQYAKDFQNKKEEK